ncbi:MAG: cobalt-precorrin-5B (C(1))-methyltransferase CbiD [Fastidiosipilaceae bacterium]|jgi:cobalt-precorrin-5B (C1)-methyltransferase
MNPISENNVDNKNLRSGFTTGSAATAAATASAMLLVGDDLPNDRIIPVRTPGGERLRLKVDTIERLEQGYRCCVVKDGGDDPDVTTGLSVCAVVALNDDKGVVRFQAGEGVGIVTLPGLKIPPGEPAINPVPREMIRRAVEPYLPEGHGFLVELSVPGGDEVAHRTFNPRLGIEGGISIIGTTGIVRPMSEEAWKDSLAEELRVARAVSRSDSIILSFGNQSEISILRHEDICVDGEGNAIRSVMCSNFVGFMLRKAAECGFKRVIISGPLGKIIKVSAGIFYTHSHVADARAELVVANAALMGVSLDTLNRLAECRTTDAALDILATQSLAKSFSRRIADKAKDRIMQFEGLGLLADVFMTDGTGDLLWTTLRVHE